MQAFIHIMHYTLSTSRMGSKGNSEYGHVTTYQIKENETYDKKESNYFVLTHTFDPWDEVIR